MLKNYTPEDQKRIEQMLDINGLGPNSVDWVKNPETARRIEDLMKEFLAAPEDKRRPIGRQIVSEIDGA